MKKICYIVTIPLTIRAFFIPQLKSLAQKGLEVHVICSSDNELQTELGDKVKYIPLDMPRGISFKGTLKAILSLIKIFKKEKYDLIQYSTPNAAFNASIAGKLAGIKKRNYHLMGLRYEGDEGIKRKILKSMEKLSCSFSTSIECVSKSSMNTALKDNLFKKEKGTVVWNGSTGGIDISRFAHSKRDEWRKAVRAELGYTEDDFVYGFAGRITRDKGINELIEAYKMLNTDDKLLFIGNMEGKETLDSKLLSYAQNNENILWHDAVTDIERYYAAMDVLILPSYREGFGNVVIEAGAVGTPAIVSDIPGPVDTISENETAFSFEVKNANELCKAMKKIRESDFKLMGEKAADFAKAKFDSKILNEKIYERKVSLLNG